MPTILAQADPFIVLWVLLIIAFVIGELISVGLTSIWFAAGALAALLLALLGVGPLVQFAVFLIVSIVLLLSTRSWAQRFINSRTQKTNADSIIGQTIRIAERVSNRDQTGMAIVHGQEWTVRARSDDEVIEKDQNAKVVEISGVKLIVEKEG
ncbi:MAG: NfeD family protein [Agathobacter sp.]